jgi:hypothetical protein
MDKAGMELSNATNAMDNYLKRHSKDLAAVIPNPTAIAVAVAQTLTALPPKMTATPAPTNIPSPTSIPILPTQTPSINNDDANYLQDMSKCVFWYGQMSKSSNDFNAATKDGTIYNVQLCATIAAIAITNADEAFSCTNNAHLPQDKDLWTSRNSYLKALQTARSAWTLVGFSCSSGIFDTRIAPLMEQASTDMTNGTKALNHYGDRHPEFKLPSTTSYP